MLSNKDFTQIATAEPITVRPRVWLLTNLPSPYQVELFQAVAGRCEVDLHVRFMRTPAVDPQFERRESTFSHRVLCGLAPRWWRDEFRLHPRAIWEAARGKYDCYVLSGLYTSVTFLLCACILWLRGAAWAMWLERPRPAGPARWWGNRFVRGRGMNWIRGAVLRRLLRVCPRTVCIGTVAVEYYADVLGVPREKLLMLPYCCDVKRFAAVGRDRVEAVQQQYDLAGKFVFLYSGQLIPRKGVDVLLRAFARLAQDEPDVVLLVLGDGPLRQELEQSVSRELRDRVRFVGWVEQERLPAFFAAGDVFVFPSRHDGWGVVVNEACAAGLPVIATRNVGAARDLVRDGQSGFLVDAGAVEPLWERMRHYVACPADAATHGVRSRQLVEAFTIDGAAQRFGDHVRAVLAASKGPTAARCVPDSERSTVKCESCR
jgi:glycosyltransferase involved in cell wall biosynthesis